jgi:hypothetical protein
MKPEREKRLRFLSCWTLVWSLGGCAIGLYQYPAIAQKIDYQTSYPPYQAQEVYFFLSKDAFPADTRSIPVATLLTPANVQWTYRDLVREFQKKAAEIGADAVVFDQVGSSNLSYGFRIYSGTATAYRLFKKDPSEDVDLSNAPYGTQDPDLNRVGKPGNP